LIFYLIYYIYFNENSLFLCNENYSSNFDDIVKELKLLIRKLTLQYYGSTKLITGGNINVSFIGKNIEYCLVELILNDQIYKGELMVYYNRADCIEHNDCILNRIED